MVGKYHNPPPLQIENHSPRDNMVGKYHNPLLSKLRTIALETLSFTVYFKPSCGDIYRPYTYCHQRQFMPLRSAHCRPKAYIVAGMNFLPWYIVVGNNMCQSVPHIVSPHSVQHSKKIFG